MVFSFGSLWSGPDGAGPSIEQKMDLSTQYPYGGTTSVSSEDQNRAKGKDHGVDRRQRNRRLTERVELRYCPPY